MGTLVLIIILLFPVATQAAPVIDHSVVQAQSTRAEPLTIDEVLARIEPGFRS